MVVLSRAASRRSVRSEAPVVELVGAFMSDRCDLSDLPVDQCACRIHAPTEPPTLSQRIDGRILATFFARYDGRCEICDRPIISGEPICSVEHLGYVHKDCAV